MLRSLFDSTTIPVLQEMIRFSSARHGVLAGNVANMNTPGYRVRDLSVESFQEKLRSALEAKREARSQRTAGADQEGWQVPDTWEMPDLFASPGIPTEMSPGILSRNPDDSVKNVGDAMQGVLYHDDTNMNMEQQVAELSKNYFLHNLSISVLNAQFRMLQTAVTERV